MKDLSLDDPDMNNTVESQSLSENKSSDVSNEVISLRWLCIQFPFIVDPQNELDMISNTIHCYCKAAADKLEELQNKLDDLQNKYTILSQFYNDDRK